MQTVFITGSAGFIGYHLSQAYLSQGHRVVGLDNFNDYYDIQLKRDRNALLSKQPNYKLIETSLEERSALETVIAQYKPHLVFHLAAQAGVRHSIENPYLYVQSNIVGTLNLLEALKVNKPQHCLFASSSSVYGMNQQMPLNEEQKTNSQVSLYAATKKANESMVHAYAHLYGLKATMLRFFTVFGPWGRPDMAPMKFAALIAKNKPIDVYNHGKMARDFTYIDSLIQALQKLAPVAPPLVQEREGLAQISGDTLSHVAPYRLVNMGGSGKIELGRFIDLLEQELGLNAHKNYMGMQAGDVKETWADPSLLTALTGHKFDYPLEQGVKQFVAWYKSYYKL